METLPLDQNGHLFGRSDTARVHRFTDEDTKSIREHVPHIAEAGLMIAGHDLSWSCAWCDTSRDLKVIDGVVKQIEPCPYPEGITTTTYLTVPSGKIVVYDDLRDVYNGFDEGFASYNSVLGQHQVIEAMAKLGCAFGPVGNSCPSLYHTGGDTFVIANPEYDEDEGERVLPPRWTELTSITTDLWAYSIADHDDYLAKGGQGVTGRYSGPSVVEVEPGTYRFTHHTGERGFDHYGAGTVVFADIRRID